MIQHAKTVAHFIQFRRQTRNARLSVDWLLQSGNEGTRQETTDSSDFSDSSIVKLTIRSFGWFSSNCPSDQTYLYPPCSRRADRLSSKLPDLPLPGPSTRAFVHPSVHQPPRIQLGLVLVDGLRQTGAVRSSVQDCPPTNDMTKRPVELVIRSR
jgi:hypothetical protein